MGLLLISDLFRGVSICIAHTIGSTCCRPPRRSASYPTRDASREIVAGAATTWVASLSTWKVRGVQFGIPIHEPPERFRAKDSCKPIQLVFPNMRTRVAASGNEDDNVKARQ